MPYPSYLQMRLPVQFIWHQEHIHPRGNDKQGVQTRVPGIKNGKLIVWKNPKKQTNGSQEHHDYNVTYQGVQETVYFFFE